MSYGKFSARDLLCDVHGNGSPGGNFVFDFHRLLGDGNGDRTVDAADLSLFGNAFGFGIANPQFNAAYDFNIDGTVDGGDFIRFGNSFGLSI